MSPTDVALASLEAKAQFSWARYEELVGSYRDAMSVAAWSKAAGDTAAVSQAMVDMHQHHHAAMYYLEHFVTLQRRFTGLHRSRSDTLYGGAPVR